MNILEKKKFNIMENDCKQLKQENSELKTTIAKLREHNTIIATGDNSELKKLKLDNTELTKQNVNLRKVYDQISNHNKILKDQMISDLHNHGLLIQNLEKEVQECLGKIKLSSGTKTITMTISLSE